VKHILLIDNAIRMHILSYSLIVFSYGAYIRNGTPSERTIPPQMFTITN
jgi:hypothetical protein